MLPQQPNDTPWRMIQRGGAWMSRNVYYMESVNSGLRFRCPTTNLGFRTWRNSCESVRVSVTQP